MLKHLYALSIRVGSIARCSQPSIAYRFLLGWSDGSQHDDAFQAEVRHDVLLQTNRQITGRRVLDSPLVLYIDVAGR